MLTNFEVWQCYSSHIFTSFFYFKDKNNNEESLDSVFKPQASQCPEKEMNKSFENQQRDLCREVQHASEVPKNNSKKFCVIGSPMKIFKKQNFYHCAKILSGNQTKTHD